jgi:hypothetical protein
MCIKVAVISFLLSSFFVGVSQTSLKDYAKGNQIVLSEQADELIYIVGWSKKGRVAFIQSHQDKSVCVVFDNVKDSVLWSLPLANSIELSNQEIQSFNKALTTYLIERTEGVELKQFPIVNETEQLAINIVKDEQVLSWSMVGSSESLDIPLIKDFTIYLNSSTKGKKVVTRKDDLTEPSHIDVKGYIKSPFENRVFIIVRFDYFSTMTEKFEVKMKYYGSKVGAYYSK